jgi:hypothetical protein
LHSSLPLPLGKVWSNYEIFRGKGNIVNIDNPKEQITTLEGQLFNIVLFSLDTQRELFLKKTAL